MSIKFTIQSFELGGVAPYGWAPFPGKWNGGVIGHEFTMVATIKLKSSRDFVSKPTVDKLPALIWREKEFWYEQDPSGDWVYKGETDKGDLYQSAPTSPTWSGFAQATGTDVTRYLWVTEPGADVTVSLRPKLLNTAQQGCVAAGVNMMNTLKSGQAYKKLEAQSKIQGRYNENKIAQWWLVAQHFADKNQALIVAALDRPGMANSGGSGKSGGGFTSLTTAPSRRRILQFDLGMVGTSTRFTVTQILETINGEPSISKFLIPGMSDDWCKAPPDDALAYWRGHLDKTDVYNQTHTLEDQNTITQWCAAQQTPTTPKTPWVRATPSFAPKTPWVRATPSPGLKKP